MLGRRQFLAGSAAIAFAAPMTATAQTADTEDYPHITLNTGSLSQYPDTSDTIRQLLDSEAFAGKYVMLELVAGWCSHCDRQKPEMDAALAGLAAQGAQIARLTIYYEESDYAGAYRNAVRYFSQSASFPETQIWKDGAVLGYFAGAHNRDKITQILTENFPDMLPPAARPAPVPSPAPAP